MAAAAVRDDAADSTAVLDSVDEDNSLFPTNRGVLGLVGRAVGVASSAVETASALLSPPVPSAQLAPFTEDALRLIVQDLFRGSAAQQLAVLQSNFAPECLVTAGPASTTLGSSAGAELAPAGEEAGEGAGRVSLADGQLTVQVRGPEAAAHVLRGLRLLASTKVQIKRVAIQNDRALILTTLNVSYWLLPLTWWWPVRADVAVHFQFGPRGRIARAAFVGSWASLLWGPWHTPLAAFLAHRWANVSGAVVSAAVGWARRSAAVAEVGKGLHGTPPAPAASPSKGEKAEGGGEVRLRQRLVSGRSAAAAAAAAVGGAS